MLGIVGRIWKKLEDEGIKPSEFLRSDNDGVDGAWLRRKFDEKMASDLSLAGDEDFRRRYVNGYEFPKLRRFRQDTAAWNSFVHSFGVSIAVEAEKPNTESKVTKAIGSALGVMGLELTEMEPRKIIGVLRKSWGQKTILIEGRRETVGEFISGYYWPEP